MKNRINFKLLSKFSILLLSIIVISSCASTKSHSSKSRNSKTHTSKSRSSKSRSSKEHYSFTQVSGIVMDEYSNPIAHSIIHLDGANRDVVTDSQGKYSFNRIKKGQNMVVTSIGYDIQIVPIENQTQNIVMKSDKVNVGFGSQSRDKITSSVATIGSEIFDSRPARTVMEMLQGMVPGLNISHNSGSIGDTSINIRGTGTISETSVDGPLILIDGAQGDVNSLNPQDVENISVLKDAAAASLYGSQAAFGVILITTKSGK
ncbi:MAG: TonB-dependent receptor plug domain-containing protein [Rikenellaceae bacterium]